MENSQAAPDAIFKLILLGDSGVDKSSLFFSSLKVTSDLTTTGVEYGANSIQMKDKLVKLQICDTAGQEAFKAVTRSFYRIADGVVLMYDVTYEGTAASGVLGGICRDCAKCTCCLREVL